MPAVIALCAVALLLVAALLVLRAGDVSSAIVEIKRGELGLNFLTIALAVVAVFVTVIAVGIILMMRKG